MTITADTASTRPAAAGAPPLVRWILQVRTPHGAWMMAASPYDQHELARAEQLLAEKQARFPDWEHRLVQAVTTFIAHQPAKET